LSGGKFNYPLPDKGGLGVGYVLKSNPL